MVYNIEALTEAHFDGDIYVYTTCEKDRNGNIVPTGRCEKMLFGPECWVREYAWDAAASQFVGLTGRSLHSTSPREFSYIEPVPFEDSYAVGYAVGSDVVDSFLRHRGKRCVFVEHNGQTVSGLLFFCTAGYIFCGLVMQVFKTIFHFAHVSVSQIAILATRDIRNRRLAFLNKAAATDSGTSKGIGRDVETSAIAIAVGERQTGCGNPRIATFHDKRRDKAVKRSI